MFMMNKPSLEMSYRGSDSFRLSPSFSQRIVVNSSFSGSTSYSKVMLPDSPDWRGIFGGG